MVQPIFTSTRLSRRRPYMNTSHNTQPFSLLTVVVVRVYELRGSEEDIKVIHFNHTSRYRFCGVFNKDRSYMMNIYTTVHIYERLEKKRWDLRKNTLRRKTDLKFQGEGVRREISWKSQGGPIIKSGVVKKEIKIFTIGLWGNYPTIMVDPPVEWISKDV